MGVAICKILGFRLQILGVLTRSGARDAQAHHHHQLRDGDDPPAAPLPQRMAAQLMVPTGTEYSQPTGWKLLLSSGV